MFLEPMISLFLASQWMESRHAREEAFESMPSAAGLSEPDALLSADPLEAAYAVLGEQQGRGEDGPAGF